MTDSVSLCKYIDVKIKFTKFTISKMLEENQYCKEIKNKQLKKEPIMTKDNIRHFQMVNKCIHHMNLNVDKTNNDSWIIGRNDNLLSCCFLRTP